MIAKLCLTDLALTVSPVPHLFNVELSECNRGDTCAQASSSERNSGMILNNWIMLFREHMFRFSLSFFRSKAENPLMFSSILSTREKALIYADKDELLYKNEHRYFIKAKYLCAVLKEKDEVGRDGKKVE